jgi:chromosome partitioning protein
MAFHRKEDPFLKQLFLNFKGGTGKTTLSAAYGLLQAERGRRVLFVDLDPQGHLTKCVGVNEWQFDKTLYHVLLHGTPVQDIMKKIHGLDAYVVPADFSLSAAELAISAQPHREWLLVHALSPLRKEFDLVVLDSSPTISLLNLNAILACNDLIVPMLPDSLSQHGLKSVIRTLTAIEEDFGHRIGNIGILLNRFLKNDAHCRKVRKSLQETYTSRILKTVIHDDPDFGRQPILYRFGSRLTTEGQAREDFAALAREIGPRRAQKPNRRKRK